MKSAGKPGSDEIEQLKRLIEIQTQIVELAKQNENAKKECKVLRDELSCEVRRRALRSARRGRIVPLPKGQPSSWAVRIASIFSALFRRVADFVAASRANLFAPKRDA